MAMHFIQSCVFLLLALLSFDAAAQVRIPASDFSPIKINEFKVEAFDIKAGQLAYQITYEAWDISGEVVESGEPDPRPPFAKCVHQKGLVSTVIEWGIVNLGSQKVTDVTLLQMPVRDKKDCQTEKQSLEKFTKYKLKVSELDLKLGSEVKLLAANEISKALKFASVRGRELAPIFKSLNKQQRSEVFAEFCSYFEDEKEIDGTTGSSAGLNFIQSNNRMIYLDGFCPNIGALAPHYSYELRGFMGDKDSFVGLVNEVESVGATAGPDKQYFIQFTPRLSL